MWGDPENTPDQSASTAHLDTARLSADSQRDILETRGVNAREHFEKRQTSKIIPSILCSKKDKGCRLLCAKMFHSPFFFFFLSKKIGMDHHLEASFKAVTCDKAGARVNIL